MSRLTVARSLRARYVGLVAWVLLTASLLAAAPPPSDPQKTPDEPDPQPRVVLPDESGYSASPADGRGTVTVSPDVVPVRSPVRR